MTITAAQLVANVSVTGAAQAKADLASVGDAANGSSSMLKTALGGMAVAAGAALVGIGVQSVKMAGDFQSSMVSLVTGAGESQKNLKTVSDGILSLATQTGTSTQQLSAGMYMIESAGFHGAQGLSVLKAAAEGAKVGGADLGTVASAVTTVMHDYASSNFTATEATNALVTTVASGKTHMQDLASSMSAVLPLASSLHIPFQQVAGAIATMTNAGMPAQQASQNLAFAIRALNVESSKGSDALTNIGLSAEEVHNDLMNKGLPATLQLIEDHIGKNFPLSSMRGQQALKDIMGGAVGLNVALMVGGSHMKEYTSDIASIGASLTSSSKDVQGWALVQQSFNQKLADAQEFIETLGIKIGTALLPIVSKAIDLFIQVGGEIENAFSSIDWNKVFAPFKPAIANIQGFIASINFKAIDFKGLENDVKMVVQVFLSLLPAGNLMQALSSHAQELGKWFNTSVVPALKGAQPGFTNLMQSLQGLLPAILTISNVIHTTFQKAFTDLLPVFQVVIPLVIQIAGIIANLLGAAIKFLTPYVVQATTALLQFADGIIQRVTPIVVQFFNNMQVWLNWLEKYWPQIWGTIAPYLQSVWDGIVGIVKIAWALVSGIIMIGLDILSGNWKQAWTDLGTMLGGIWSGIQDIIKGGVNLMISSLNLGIDALNGFIDAVENALDSVAKAVGLGSPIPITSIPLIPAYASGTDSHPGGAALVGEKGPEIAILPRGTSVIPAHLTSQILSGMPAYADGTNNILQNLMNWVSGGAQSILNNILKGLNLNLNLGEMSGMASGITKTVEQWALDWINKTLMPALPVGGGGNAGPGTPVNIPGNLASWIMSAIGLTGVPANWANDLGIIAMHESGGNPSAINNWDINAQEGHPSQGIMQTIPSTFAAYMLPGHGNILNPIDNIAAAIGYIKSRYGTVFNVPGIVSMANGGAYQGYADGTDYASGGWSWVGERGKELMYVPRGAQITSHEALNKNSQPIQITVQPAAINIDGRTLANNQLPYIVNAIRYNVGSHNI